MKKNIFTKKVTTAILAGALALSFAGCSELDPEVDANAQAQRQEKNEECKGRR